MAAPWQGGAATLLVLLLLSGPGLAPRSVGASRRPSLLLSHGLAPQGAAGSFARTWRRGERPTGVHHGQALAQCVQGSDKKPCEGAPPTCRNLDRLGCLCSGGNCVSWCHAMGDGAECSASACDDPDGCVCANHVCQPFCVGSADGSECSSCGEGQCHCRDGECVAYSARCGPHSNGDVCKGPPCVDKDGLGCLCSHESCVSWCHARGDGAACACEGGDQCECAAHVCQPFCAAHDDGAACSTCAKPPCVCMGRKCVKGPGVQNVTGCTAASEGKACTTLMCKDNCACVDSKCVPVVQACTAATAGSRCKARTCRSKDGLGCLCAGQRCVSWCEAKGEGAKCVSPTYVDRDGSLCHSHMCLPFCVAKDDGTACKSCGAVTCECSDGDCVVKRNNTAPPAPTCTNLTEGKNCSSASCAVKGGLSCLCQQGACVSWCTARGNGTSCEGCGAVTCECSDGDCVVKKSNIAPPAPTCTSLTEGKNCSSALCAVKGGLSCLCQRGACVSWCTVKGNGTSCEGCGAATCECSDGDCVAKKNNTAPPAPTCTNLTEGKNCSSASCAAKGGLSCLCQQGACVSWCTAKGNGTACEGCGAVTCECSDGDCVANKNNTAPPTPACTNATEGQPCSSASCAVEGGLSCLCQRGACVSWCAAKGDGQGCVSTACSDKDGCRCWDAKCQPFCTGQKDETECTCDLAECKCSDGVCTGSPASGTGGNQGAAECGVDGAVCEAGCADDYDNCFCRGGACLTLCATHSDGTECSSCDDEDTCKCKSGKCENAP